MSLPFLLRYRYAASQPFKNRELLRSFLSLPLRGYAFDEKGEIHTHSNKSPEHSQHCGIELPIVKV
jgi:hypothetical protein